MLTGKYINRTGEVETVEYASKEELLEFVNLIRSILDQEPLVDLVPSIPGEADMCLIANSIGFGSPNNFYDISVDAGLDEVFYMDICLDGKYHDALATVLVVDDENWDRFYLPDFIGGAAVAFDNGVDFKEYVEPDSVVPEAT